MAPSAWKLLPADPVRADRLARELDLHPLTAQLLLHRGVADAASARRFLSPSLHDLAETPVPDLARAVSRIRKAIATREPIDLFSDSDTDGLTASVILYEALTSLGATVRAQPSNRIADGYGLPASFIQRLIRSSATLLMVADCGTNQSEAIRELAAHGIDTIIVDHHVPLAGWAEPYALVNPHRESSGPGRELCSAGLALRIAQALLDDSGDSPASYADLAALGTLSDAMPLRGSNRGIVTEGLPRIVHSERPGLRRLCEETRTHVSDPEHVIMRLTPRLNASGRLGDAGSVWELLRRDASGVEAHLGEAARAHQTTRRLFREVIGQAQEQVNRLHFRDEFVVVVAGSGWHQGIMGPLASQLTGRFGRPAIAVAMDERQGVGSGRSIPAFNLLHALRACEDVLVRFGGHAQACGLTIERKHLEEFRALINRHAQRFLGRDGLVKEKTVELELPLGAIEPRWVEETERFAPFGSGNSRPTVVIRQVRIEQQSARSAILTDGDARVAARGTFSTVAPEGRYDVAASPRLVKGELMLAVSDVKVSSPRATRQVSTAP